MAFASSVRVTYFRPCLSQARVRGQCQGAGYGSVLVIVEKPLKFVQRERDTERERSMAIKF